MKAGYQELTDFSLKLRQRWAYVPIALVVLAIQLSFPSSTPALLIGLCFHLGFTMDLVFISGGVTTPFTVVMIGALMYSYLPFLPGQVPDLLMATFGLDGGYVISAVANCCLIVAIYVSVILLPVKAGRSRAAMAGDIALTTAGIAAAAVSSLLTLIYIARFGAVGFGNVAYDQSFIQRQETGAGILFLGVPLALSAAAVLMTRDRLTYFKLAVSLIPFVLLIGSTGQRKFIIMPALTLVSTKLRVKSLYSISLIIIGVAFGEMLFGYLEFLRLNEYGISDALNSNYLGDFFNEIGLHLSGETPALMATASSAYQDYMAPLPYMGDYLRSWEMSTPQYYLGLQTFDSANDRFAFQFTPEFAALGGGWGYSFFGEAYMVAWFPGVVIMTTGVVFVFRWIYVNAMQLGRNSLFYAMMICGVYHILWIQRNAFAFFLKEYVVYQGATVLAIFVAARGIDLITARMGRRPRSSQWA